MQQHQGRKDIIPAIGMHMIPATKNIIPIRRPANPDRTANQNGSNPAANALSINPSEQIHATYSGAERSVIGKARIPTVIQASMSPNVQQNPGHAISSPIMKRDSTNCITPQSRANKAAVNRSV